MSATPGDAAVSAIDAVVTAVLASRRYRSLHPATVRRVAAEQLALAAGPVDAIKRSKRALHQIFGAYLPRPARWSRLLAQLREAEDAADRRDALRHAMAHHASTRERLDQLERFYDELGSRIGTPSSVLDLACGLGPLATPWLGLRARTPYHAWDIDVAMVEFVGECIAHLGLDAHVGAVDLLDVPSWPATDVALLLKTVPCLEQQRTGAAEALLAVIPAPRVVVSFPTRSLGGRSKGMHGTYARRFEAVLGARGWQAETFEVGPELVYVVDRGAVR